MDWTPVLAAVSTGLVAIIGALVAFLVAKLKTATTKEEVEEIKVKQEQMEIQIQDVQKQAALKHLYVKCNKCGNEIDLSTADIYTKEEEKEEVKENDNN